MRLIDVDALKDKQFGAFGWLAGKDLTAATTIDAVPVVRCEKCVLHGNCTTEDAFILAGIENPFCCVGKREEGAI